MTPSGSSRATTWWTWCSRSGSRSSHEPAPLRCGARGRGSVRPGADVGDPAAPGPAALLGGHQPPPARGADLRRRAGRLDTGVPRPAGPPRRHRDVLPARRARRAAPRRGPRPARPRARARRARVGPPLRRLEAAGTPRRRPAPHGGRARDADRRPGAVVPPAVRRAHRRGPGRGPLRRAEDLLWAPGDATGSRRRPPSPWRTG